MMEAGLTIVFCVLVGLVIVLSCAWRAAVERQKELEEICDNYSNNFIIGKGQLSGVQAELEECENSKKLLFESGDNWRNQAKALEKELDTLRDLANASHRNKLEADYFGGLIRECGVHLPGLFIRDDGSESNSVISLNLPSAVESMVAAHKSLEKENIDLKAENAALESDFKSAKAAADEHTTENTRLWKQLEGIASVRDDWKKVADSTGRASAALERELSESKAAHEALKRSIASNLAVKKPKPWKVFLTELITTAPAEKA